ncbi:MAG: hypothetical protein U0U46_01545 [Saprospiraceae bacterium]
MIERWRRLLRKRPRHGVFTAHPAWILFERLLIAAECMGIPVLVVWLNGRIKRNTRLLSEEEIRLARSILGNSIDYSRVRIDEKAVVGCRRGNFAYVGFQVINSWGPLSAAHFIHEMVHIWQFQRHGAGYIACALWAQRTARGYNYGGMDALYRAARQGQGLEAFNYEQQGDIVADYFRLSTGQAPRWCENRPEYLPVFEKIIRRSISTE